MPALITLPALIAYARRYAALIRFFWFAYAMLMCFSPPLRCHAARLLHALRYDAALFITWLIICRYAIIAPLRRCC